MSNTVSVPNTFSNLSGNVPASTLDANFAAIVAAFNSAFLQAVFGPPASNVAVTVNGLAAPNVSFTSQYLDGVQNARLEVSHSAAGPWTQLNANGSTTSACRMWLATNSVQRVGINEFGNVTINAAAANATLTILGDTVARGVAICKFKAADSANFAGVTTPAADSDLTYALPGAGTYEFEASLRISADATTAGGGLRFGVYCTATAVSTASWEFAYGNLNTTAVNKLGTSLPTTAATAAYSNAALQNGNTDWVVIKGSITVSTAGTIAVNYAQNTGTGGAVQILRSSYFKVTQLS